jgi:hypothetical protein
MVKIKASKRTNYRHILINGERKVVENLLREVNGLIFKPKFKEIFVKSLKSKFGNKLVLTVAREDVNKIKETFKGKINMLKTSGTLKGLTK